MKLRVHSFLVTALFTATVAVVSSGGVASATNPLAGKTCYAVGSTLTIPGPKYSVKYTCIKVTSGKKSKLVWNAGVQIANPPSLPTGNFDTTPGGPLIWSETFSGAAGTSPNVTGSTFSKTWSYVTGSGTYGTGEIENNTNLPQNLHVDGNGNLDIVAKCVDSNTTSSGNCTEKIQPMGQNWTSTRIWTNGKLDFQYGQLEAKIWMPVGAFNWPAFWMMGQNYTSLTGAQSVNWPFCGELDIAEGLQGNTTDQATIHANVPGTSIDWAGGSGFTQVAPISGAAMTSGWHTYGVLWKPNSIAYTLDGKVWAMDTYDPVSRDVTQSIRQSNGTTQSLTVGPGTGMTSSGGDWPFNAPFFIVMNDAIGGITSAARSATDPMSSTMQIGWIKYYGYSGYGSVTQYTPKS